MRDQVVRSMSRSGCSSKSCSANFESERNLRMGDDDRCTETAETMRQAEHSEKAAQAAEQMNQTDPSNVRKDPLQEFFDDRSKTAVVTSPQRSEFARSLGKRKATLVRRLRSRSRGQSGEPVRGRDRGQHSDRRRGCDESFDLQHRIDSFVQDLGLDSRVKGVLSSMHPRDAEHAIKTVKIPPEVHNSSAYVITQIRMIERQSGRPKDHRWDGGVWIANDTFKQRAGARGAGRANQGLSETRRSPRSCRPRAKRRRLSTPLVRRRSHRNATRLRGARRHKRESCRRRRVRREPSYSESPRDGLYYSESESRSISPEPAPRRRRQRR
eukprot:TRINITY_DN55058_c0_g1_i1.p1 TRINITY_DN55058_c0_g1~~TRINITY_DN55058_c0_g1_i1.p1  ORF type:complete len:326 (-),score=32.33 TRINITY_DN55058_c0_g1_i1:127-1104(-)